MSLPKESQLKKLANILKAKIDTVQALNYTIPKFWDSFDYDGIEKNTIGDELLSVNPYNFYYRCIEKEFSPYINKDVNYNASLSNILNDTNEMPEGYLGGDWIRSGSIYSLHIRTTTSWDHNGSGQLELQNEYGFKETGTFLKTLVLLPILKRIGIDTIYILPIFRNSKRYAKGELGSPYAAKNFFEIDDTLKDPMLGDDFTVNQEFAAFMEACHALNFRVIIDFVPRTNARDSELILDHPDWFYWIPMDELANYSSPEVENYRSQEFGEKLLKFLYTSPRVLEHLKKFCESPDKLYPEKWKTLRDYCKENPSADFFEKIERELGVTTAPGFCDNADDIQSPWTDITYFKLFFDHPPEIRKYLENPDTQAPYILYDVIKSNNFAGEIKNQELWDLIAGVIPFYQRNFGIDGARIDMGHSLPKELELMIINNAREVDPDFCFIVELFDPFVNQTCRTTGYNMLAGDLWWHEPRLHEMHFQDFNKVLEQQQLNLWIPIFAGAETADSPRAAARAGGRKFSKLFAVFNNFVPNAVPFIFSGFEIYEMQPMNVDLDRAGSNGRACMLPESDPFYDKLPFFDRYALHWTAEGNQEIIQILMKIKDIRKKYLSTILNPKNCLPIYFKNSETKGIGFCYVIEGRTAQTKDNLLLVIASLDYTNSQELSIDLTTAREKSGNSSYVAEILYSEFVPEGTKVNTFDEQGDLCLSFEPGEIKLITL